MLLTLLLLISDTTKVRGPACSACRIILSSPDTVALVGVEGFPWGRSVQELDDGRWIVTDGNGNSLPVLLGRDHKVQLTYGRLGDGPGEFRHVYFARLVGRDTVAFVEPYRRRVTIYTVGGTFVRSGPSHEVFDIVRLPNGEYLMSGRASASRWAGASHFRYSQALEPVGAWPEVRPLAVQGKPWLQQRHFAVTASGPVWSVYPEGRPLVELRDPRTGAVLHTIRRDAPWYPEADPFATRNPNDRTEPPTARVLSIAARDSIVWITWVGVAANWQRGMGTVRGEGGRQLRLPVSEKAWNTYVEAWDARTGGLLASLRLDWVPLAATSTGALLRPGPEIQDEQSVIVFRPSLTTTQRR